MPTQIDTQRPLHRLCTPRVLQSGCPVQRIELAKPFDKPDVRIYSQDEVWSAGQQPSWDSPDMWTYLWGSSNPNRMWPDTKIRARVHNYSALGPALGVIVHCDISDWGLGTVRTRLFSQVVNIPASGTVEIDFPVPEAIVETNTFFGAHITAELPGDINQINNHGSQIIAGSASSGGREKVIDFQIVNRRNREVNLAIQVLPNSLSADVQPRSASLAPGSSIPGQLTLRVPDDVEGSPSNIEWLQASVVATENDNLMDGMSYNVAVDDSIQG